MKRFANIIARPALLGLLLAAWGAASSASAQTVPPYMAYQGYLTDGNGQPLGGANYVGTVVFRIWNVPTGGTRGGANELFAEQQSVTVNSGYFNVLLGQGIKYASENHPALASVITNAGLYVEMTVGTNTLAPRVPLLASPYAFLAQNAARANTAAYARSLAANGAGAPLVSFGSNWVSVTAPLNVTAAVTATNLTVGGPAGTTNQVLAVKGLATVAGLTVSNTLTAGSLNLTNSGPTGNLIVGGTITAGTVQVAGPLTVGPVTAGSLEAGGTVSGNSLNVTGQLAAGSVVVTNGLSAASLSVTGPAGIAGPNGLKIAGTRIAKKIIYGAVINNASTIGANWFTVRNSGNYWYVTFSQAFSATPTLLVTGLNPNFASKGRGSDWYDCNELFVDAISNTGFTLIAYNWDDPGWKNVQDFNFIAIGPP